MNYIETTDFIIESVGIQEIDVFDIEVENIHNFFANDILVHNSVYLDVNQFVVDFCKDKTIEETTKFLDSVGEKLQKIINKSCEDIRVLTGCTAKVINAKRESIASQSLFQKKKRYAMVVHNSEGVDYSPYKLKIMGLDLVKSSTPKEIRNDLKKTLEDIFFTDEPRVQKKIADLRSHFNTLSVNDIAFPRSVNDIDKWLDNKGNYKLGTPIHVRGAILYNNFTKDNRDKYPMLRDGEKVKFIYLKVPNILRENVIAWPTDSDMPEELKKYIDYDTMWEKTFIAPVKGLLDAIGWSVEEQSSLESFFV